MELKTEKAEEVNEEGSLNIERDEKKSLCDLALFSFSV